MLLSNISILSGSNRVSLQRLDRLISVCFIAMFAISTIVLAFAVKQIMTARDLEVNNSELIEVIADLHTEIKILNAEVEYLKDEFDRYIARCGLSHHQ